MESKVRGGDEIRKKSAWKTRVKCREWLKSGDLMYIGNPYNIGFKRLHFSATLAAFKGKKS